jgi:hypothetical protein
MSRERRVVVRESPFEVVERLQAAIATPPTNRILDATRAERRLCGWVDGDRFAISVLREPGAMLLSRNSWDPWLMGTVRSASAGTEITYEIGAPPGIKLWWRVMTLGIVLTLFIPIGLTIWTDDGLPLKVWLSFLLAIGGFVTALKLIETIGRRESRRLSVELEGILSAAVGAR